MSIFSHFNCLNAVIIMILAQKFVYFHHKTQIEIIATSNEIHTLFW